MAVYPTGLLSMPLDGLRSLIEACAVWRDNADEGRVYIVAPEKPEGEAFSLEELRDLRPYAVLWLGQGTSFVPRGGNTGQAIVNIEAEVPEEHQESERDAELWFLNFIGGLIRNMQEMDDGQGHMVPESIQVPEPPVRSAPESRASEGDYFSVSLVVSWRSGGY